MLSARIRDLRKNKGISQTQLAEALGVTQQAVTKWECGKASPDYNTLKKLSDFFSVSTDYLLDNDTPPYYHDPEVAEIAQAMHDTPGMRVMFDASRKLSKESIEEVQNFIKFQLSKEGKL